MIVYLLGCLLLNHIEQAKWILDGMGIAYGFNLGNFLFLKIKKTLKISSNFFNFFYIRLGNRHAFEHNLT